MKIENYNLYYFLNKKMQEMHYNNNKKILDPKVLKQFKSRHQYTLKHEGASRSRRHTLKTNDTKMCLFKCSSKKLIATLNLKKIIIIHSINIFFSV